MLQKQREQESQKAVIRPCNSQAGHTSSIDSLYLDSVVSFIRHGGSASILQKGSMSEPIGGIGNFFLDITSLHGNVSNIWTKLLQLNLTTRESCDPQLMMITGSMPQFTAKSPLSTPSLLTTLES